MKKVFSILSVSIFLFNFVVYIFFIQGLYIVPDAIFFLSMSGGSIIGFILARIGNKKGELRDMGTFGNAFILFMAIILPLLFHIFVR